jgi:hypothetical protein
LTAPVEADPSSISDAIGRCFDILVTMRQSFDRSAQDASTAKTAETIFTQVDSVLKSFQAGGTLTELDEDVGNKLKAVKKTYRQVKGAYEDLKTRRTGGKCAGRILLWRYTLAKEVVELVTRVVVLVKGPVGKSSNSHRRESSGHGWTLNAMAGMMQPTRSRRNSQSSPPSSPVRSRQPESPKSPSRSKKSGLIRRSDGQIVQIRRKA